MHDDEPKRRPGSGDDERDPLAVLTLADLIRMLPEDDVDALDGVLLRLTLGRGGSRARLPE